MDSRGRMLWSRLNARAILIINGCSLLPMDMCMIGQQGQTVVQSTVDYIILNEVTLQMAQSCIIKDHSPRYNAKNFHVHMALMLTCTNAPPSSTTAAGAMGQQFCWVPGIEGKWLAWNDTGICIGSCSCLDSGV